MTHFNFQEPPIPIEEISKFLGLSIVDVDPPPEMATPALHKALTTVPCWLERSEKKISVYKRAPKKRRRLGISHENTHFIIPYHVGINPFCSGADDPTSRKYTEREAFMGGAAMLFYPKLFIEDVLSTSSISLDIIQKLSARYDGSLEATANWYARTHPQICAIVIAEPPTQEEAVDEFLQDQFGLPINVKPHTPSPSARNWLPASGGFREEINFVMQVKYSITSIRFPKWIPPRTRIPDTSLIYKTFVTGKHCSGEIPASDLGSSSRWRYNAECMPMGDGSSNVMALIWLPDKQMDLAISSPYAGW